MAHAGRAGKAGIAGGRGRTVKQLRRGIELLDGEWRFHVTRGAGGIYRVFPTIEGLRGG